MCSVVVTYTKMKGSFFENFRLASLVVGGYFIVRALITGRIEFLGGSPIARSLTPHNFWIVWGVITSVFALILFGLFQVGS